MIMYVIYIVGSLNICYCWSKVTHHQVSNDHDQHEDE